MPKNEKQQKTSKSKKPTKSGSAAEASVPRGTRKQATPDPMQKVTRAGRKRASGGESGGGSASSTDRPQCSGTKPNGQRCRRPPVRGGELCQKHGGVAKRTNAQKRADLNAAVNGAEKVTCTAIKRSGDRCSNPPIKGATVCRMHGGGAPQVKAKANARLIDMVLPAMRELRKILDSKTASDSDKLKAVHMVLQRTGFNERHQIDIGLREPNAWDHLTGPDSPVIRIERGLGAVTVSDESQALPLGEGGGDDDDDALTAMLDRRDREREREASTRLDNAGHDVVSGAVEDDPGADADLFGFPLSPEQKRARSAYPTEHDPHPTNGAASGPARVSEQRGPGRTQGR